MTATTLHRTALPGMPNPSPRGNRATGAARYPRLRRPLLPPGNHPEIETEARLRTVLGAGAP